MKYKINIYSETGQKLSREIKNIIKEYFEAEFQIWEEQGQENIKGNYYLGIWENIKISQDIEKYIAIPIEFGDSRQDGGYLEVYGLEVVQT